jgi:hypothetical protein
MAETTIQDDTAADPAVEAALQTMELVAAENSRLRKALELVKNDSDASRRHELSVEQRFHAIHVTAETALTYPNLTR